MKFKVEVEAHNGKVKREYIVEASNGKEFSKELARVERVGYGNGNTQFCNHCVEYARAQLSLGKT